VPWLRLLGAAAIRRSAVPSDERVFLSFFEAMRHNLMTQRHRHRLRQLRRIVRKRRHGVGRLSRLQRGGPRAISYKSREAEAVLDGRRSTRNCFDFEPAVTIDHPFFAYGAMSDRGFVQGDLAESESRIWAVRRGLVKCSLVALVPCTIRQWCAAAMFTVHGYRDFLFCRSLCAS